ncbi:pyrimidine 5'-nucleotidase [Anncaliia algerae PRA339]|uniref:Pyrimidine 5'-nucleotidase n=1 Tax=Anncaliia algerae PRA339 TaxID=1288291 RepID=A0A059F187_9MICR|nr:pyrimidine 5'-nucleotidase [Anncaliia algerae PRA339]
MRFNTSSMVDDDKYIYIEELCDYKYKKSVEELFIFDIDETLYPFSEIMMMERRKKLIVFAEKLGLNPAQCVEKFAMYSHEYGCVMKGLINNYELTDWHKEVLYNPVDGTYMYLEHDRSLVDLIDKLNGTKICFTNGGKHHAREILTRIGLQNSFELIICCNFFIKNFLCKPQKEAYLMIEKSFDVGKQQIHFFDDRKVNIAVAAQLGWNAYHISAENEIKAYLAEFQKK